MLSGQPILYSSRIARYTFDNCILTCIEDCKAHGLIAMYPYVHMSIVGYVYWIKLLDGVCGLLA